MMGELISFRDDENLSCPAKIKISSCIFFIQHVFPLLVIGHLNCPNWCWLVKDMSCKGTKRNKEVLGQ
jgi:hypothetical protein